MNVAQHAEKILKAWNQADPAGFEQELEAALASCQRAEPVDHLECERQEVLESVVERLRSSGAPRGSSQSNSGSRAFSLPAARGVHAGFALLEHLRLRAAA